MQTIQPTHRDVVLSVQEKRLLSDTLSGDTPRLLLRTKTRIDTGRWLGKSPLWLCLTESDILLLAVSKRRYVQRMPISDCKDTLYCHTSGALLLQPSDLWQFNTISLAPTDAHEVLQHLKSVSQPQPSPVTEPTGA